MPRLQFERRKNAEMVARALNELSIEAVVNERNDICVEGFKICPVPSHLLTAKTDRSSPC